MRFQTEISQANGLGLKCTKGRCRWIKLQRLNGNTELHSVSYWTSCVPQCLCLDWKCQNNRIVSPPPSMHEMRDTKQSGHVNKDSCLREVTEDDTHFGDFCIAIIWGRTSVTFFSHFLSISEELWSNYFRCAACLKGYSTWKILSFTVSTALVPFSIMVHCFLLWATHLPCKSVFLFPFVVKVYSQGWYVLLLEWKYNVVATVQY